MLWGTARGKVCRVEGAWGICGIWRRGVWRGIRSNRWKHCMWDSETRAEEFVLRTTGNPGRCFRYCEVSGYGSHPSLNTPKAAN